MISYRTIPILRPFRQVLTRPGPDRAASGPGRPLAVRQRLAEELADHHHDLSDSPPTIRQADPGRGVADSGVGGLPERAVLLIAQDPFGQLLLPASANC
jgi:hypothetical protein